MFMVRPCYMALQLGLDKLTVFYGLAVILHVNINIRLCADYIWHYKLRWLWLRVQIKSLPLFTWLNRFADLLEQMHSLTSAL